MMKRFKAYLLLSRVKRLEARYRRNPTLRHLHAWSDACGALYKHNFKKSV